MADYDLLAIGDGVAGLASAISGAMLGVNCAVVSLACSPSRKPGEIVDASAWRLFERMDVADAIAAQALIVLSADTGTKAVGAAAHSANIENARIIVIPRADLEAILLHRALSLGVHFLRCSSLSVASIRKARLR